MRELQYGVVALRDLAEEDLDRWRELATVAVEPNPFFEADYLLALARALDAPDDVSLAVVADGDSWLACMPVHRVGRWRRMPLPSTSMWRGGGLLLALVGTPLVSRGCVREASAALLGGVARTSGSFFTALESLVEDGPFFEALAPALSDAGLRSLRFEQSERAFLRRRDECDYLEQAMDSHHRRGLRSQWRRLTEELGREPEVVDRAGEPDAVRELIALEGRSYLAARGSVLQSDPAQARFFVEMCAAFAAQGRLQLLALQAGDRTIAIKCNILADAGIFFLKVAYDEDYRRFSPGIQLETRMFPLFHERPKARWMDSCAYPGNETWNKLLPERRSLVTVTVLAPTLRGRAALPMIRATSYLRARRAAG
jgi:CelD/BcsL family acetyltransferase involved in cellulose biosynthesis